MSEPAPTDANNSEVQIVAADPRSVKVWDPVVRIGHWLLAGGFLTAYLTAEENQPIHVLAGYTVATVVVLRILWGFFGTTHALGCRHFFAVNCFGEALPFYDATCFQPGPNDNRQSKRFTFVFIHFSDLILHQDIGALCKF